MKCLLVTLILVTFNLAQASTLKCLVDEEMGPWKYITKDLSSFDGSAVSIGQIGGLPVDVGISYTGEYHSEEIGKICAHIRTSGDYQRICSESKLNLVRLVQVDNQQKIESIYISCEINK